MEHCYTFKIVFRFLLIILYIKIAHFNYTNKCTYIKFHIKALKIAPTYFDPKIIFREPCCSLLTHVLKTLTD